MKRADEAIIIDEDIGGRQESLRIRVGASWEVVRMEKALSIRDPMS